MEDDKNTNRENVQDYSKVQYKQMILILLLTLIMSFVCSFLVFSSVKIISYGKNLNYNSIITKLPENPKGEDDKLVFKYIEKNIIGNGISIENAFPVSDEIGKMYTGSDYTFQFKLKVNNKARDIDYEITAEKMGGNNTLKDKYVKLYLESDGVSLLPLRSNGRIKTFDEFENATINKENSNEKKLFASKVSKEDVKRGYRDFVLKMWLTEGITMNAETSNKSFRIRINVYAKWVNE